MPGLRAFADVERLPHLPVARYTKSAHFPDLIWRVEGGKPMLDDSGVRPCIGPGALMGGGASTNDQCFETTAACENRVGCVAFDGLFSACTFRSDIGFVCLEMLWWIRALGL